MARPTRPGDDNIRYLRQGLELVRVLDDAQYAEQPSGSTAGVGAQLRHCLDFYACFFAGLAEGRIDYTRRERDPGVESDRDRAARRIEALIHALEGLHPDRVDADVRVRLDSTETEPEGWCRSSVQRELQFLVSHTIHHYALIAFLLRQQGLELGERFAAFGVAPSTLGYWSITGAVSR